ncbi:hypothetical protein KIPB_010642, partial [Kipferlia bialata]
WMSWRDRAKDD